MFEQDEAIDVDLTTLVGQKKSIDQCLEPIVERILGKYPVGQCKEHPDIHCIKYEPNQWHFHLDSNRVRVFAMAVLKKEVNGNLTEIPLSSAHFKHNQTIGYHNRHTQSSTTPISHESTRASAPPQPYSYPSTPMNMPYPYGQQSPMPMPYATPFGYFPTYPMPYPMYGPSPGQTPSMLSMTNLVPHASMNVPQGQHEVRLSPPVPRCDLKEWCEMMNLSDTIYNSLVKLRFQVGDSLDGMPDSEWQKVGLTWLEWQRVVDAYRRYKVEKQ
ncbi:hypothetical protein EV360DRAFT_79736 [Lentinula raphanica]|nr:hypothetical protein EV360DRAFT_79736 [Lentinula raphanica]